MFVFFVTVRLSVRKNIQGFLIRYLLILDATAMIVKTKFVLIIHITCGLIYSVIHFGACNKSSNPISSVCRWHQACRSLVLVPRRHRFKITILRHHCSREIRPNISPAARYWDNRINIHCNMAEAVLVSAEAFSLPQYFLSLQYCSSYILDNRLHFGDSVYKCLYISIESNKRHK